jgi:hypothetical protein
MSACQCCEEFPTDVLTLEARYRAISANACALYEFEDGNLLELYGLGGGSGAILSTGYNQVTITYTTSTYSDGTNEPFVIERGGGELIPWTGPVEEVFTVQYNTETCSCETTNTGFRPEDGGDQQSDDIEFSESYTKPNFISDTSACISDFSEWEGATAAATEVTYALSVIDDAVVNIYSVSDVEFRFTHPPTATGYLKVWIWQRVYDTRDEVGNWVNPVDLPYDTYEWIGQPPDLQYGIDESENKIVSDPFAPERAEENTRVEFFVAKWSLLPGYEPDDPLVDEETFELSRPSPDCESNGVPTLNEECPFRE